MIAPQLLRAALASLIVASALVGCASPPTWTEPDRPDVPGFIDHSYDKNTVLFSTRAADARVAFMDSIQPFDPPLRYNHAEPLVQVALALPTVQRDGVLMVSLEDLRRLYAPYLGVKLVQSDGTIEITHHRFDRQVLGGQGSRAPTMRFAKQVVVARASLGRRDLWVSMTGHSPVTPGPRAAAARHRTARADAAVGGPRPAAAAGPARRRRHRRRAGAAALGAHERRGDLHVVRRHRAQRRPSRGAHAPVRGARLRLAVPAVDAAAVDRRRRRPAPRRPRPVRPDTASSACTWASARRSRWSSCTP